MFDWIEHESIIKKKRSYYSLRVLIGERLRNYSCYDIILVASGDVMMKMEKREVHRGAGSGRRAAGRRGRAGIRVQWPICSATTRRAGSDAPSCIVTPNTSPHTRTHAPHFIWYLAGLLVT